MAVATRTATFRDAINEALRLEMARDPDVILMGEDVAGGADVPGFEQEDAWGGVLGVTKGLVEEFQERTGVLAIAEVDPAVAAELTGRAADVVQLAREALSNVGRHAHAATCRVSLFRADREVVLEVDDDGRGFDPARTTGGGQGLRNLRERAEALGGRAEVHSTVGDGTTVRVMLPR